MKDRIIKLIMAYIESVMEEKDENTPAYSENLNLIDDLGFDSIDLVNLVVYIEEELKISCNTDELIEYLDRLGELVDYLSSLICMSEAEV